MFRRPASMTKTTYNKKEIKSFTKSFEKAIKILLLGTGESGKSTIINQMKILHINEFTAQERLERVPIIRQNLHESMYDIVSNLERLGLSFDSPANQQSAQWLLKMGKILGDDFKPVSSISPGCCTWLYERLALLTISCVSLSFPGRHLCGAH